MTRGGLEYLMRQFCRFGQPQQAKGSVQDQAGTVGMCMAYCCLWWLCAFGHWCECNITHLLWLCGWMVGQGQWRKMEGKWRGNGGEMHRNFQSSLLLRSHFAHCPRGSDGKLVLPTVAPLKTWHPNIWSGKVGTKVSVGPRDTGT